MPRRRPICSRSTAAFPPRLPALCGNASLFLTLPCKPQTFWRSARALPQLVAAQRLHDPIPVGFLTSCAHPGCFPKSTGERARLSPDSPSLTPLAAGLGRGRDAPRHLACCWMYPGRIRHGEKGGQSVVKLRDQFASQRPHLVCKHSAGAAASLLLLLPPQQCFAPVVKAGSPCFSLWSGCKLSQVRREQREHLSTPASCWGCKGNGSKISLPTPKRCSKVPPGTFPRSHTIPAAEDWGKTGEKRAQGTLRASTCPAPNQSWTP